MLGFKGIFIDAPERLASAWQEALSSDRPVVLEVKTDPEVAPLPPHVTSRKPAHSCRRWPEETERGPRDRQQPQHRSSMGYLARRNETRAAVRLLAGKRLLGASVPAAALPETLNAGNTMLPRMTLRVLKPIQYSRL